MEALLWIWLAVLVLAVISEIATTDLTSIWFAIGAIGSIIVYLIFPKAIYAQIITFCVISGSSIFFLRPIIKKKLEAPKIATNIDSVIGKIVVVESAIALNQPGTIKVEGIVWTAITEGKSFEVGDLVEIIKVIGNKFIVDSIKQE